MAQKRSQDAPGRHLGPLGPLVGGMADKRDDHHAEQGKENKRHDNGNELQVVGREHLVEGESELGENRTADADDDARRLSVLLSQPHTSEMTKILAHAHPIAEARNAAPPTKDGAAGFVARTKAIETPNSAPTQKIK